MELLLWTFSILINPQTQFLDLEVQLDVLRWQSLIEFLGGHFDHLYMISITVDGIAMKLDDLVVWPFLCIQGSMGKEAALYMCDFRAVEAADIASKVKVMAVDFAGWVVAHWDGWEESGFQRLAFDLLSCETKNAYCVRSYRLISYMLENCFPLTG